MNIKVTLPDGSIREYPAGSSPLDVANSISPNLAKAVIAAKINGGLKDIYIPLNNDCSLELIKPESKDGLEIIRHDTAHLMAAAVQKLYPETKVTIGPVIDNGFYYDFARPTPFSSDDLSKIEAKMHEIAALNEKISFKTYSRSDAIKFFENLGENYKVEIISAIPENEEIKIYFHGDFPDLCRGPHLPSTGFIKHFKLLKVSGAYWRGDSSKAQLQRIYGTAWASEKDLKAYLMQIEEAEKRDHRKAGKELDWFHFQDDAPGMVFWHPKGWVIYSALKKYIQDKCKIAGYQEVCAPQLLSSGFWEKSGHWEKFQENMFSSVIEEQIHALKPMNCPGHVQIFRSNLRSYRELPLRLLEFSHLHRNEPSGALHGLLRLRSFSQDDGHIFCTEEQINSETKDFCDLLMQIYADLGFNEIAIKFATRPAKRAGSDETWDKAENALAEAVKAAGLEYEIIPGEGAFYGPKLEFHLKDAIGRSWQCGTIQVDFVLPERLDASYIGSDGAKHRPVMLHRAILGSFERFIGMLIENYEAKLPIWLSPVQVVVATITNDVDDYAYEVYNKLKAGGIRCEIDNSADKISYKIRQHSLQKIPVLAVVGKKEAAENIVNVRRIGSEEQIAIKLDEFIAEMTKKCIVN